MCLCSSYTPNYRYNNKTNSSPNYRYNNQINSSPNYRYNNQTNSSPNYRYNNQTNSSTLQQGNKWRRAHNTFLKLRRWRRVLGKDLVLLSLMSHPEIFKFQDVIEIKNKTTIFL